MRSLSVVVIAVAVATGLCAPSGSNEEHDKMRDFAEAFRDYQVALLSTLDPLNLPDVNKSHVVWDKVPLDIVYSAHNRVTRNLSNVDINIMSTNPDRMTMAYALRYPTLEYTSNFEVEGTALNQSVSGQGSYKLTLDGVFNQANITLEEVKSDNPDVKSPYIQIASIEQRILFGNFTVKIAGLTVGSLTEEQIDTLIKDTSVEQFNKNIRAFEKVQGEQVKQQLNKRLVGHDLDDVIAWLKKHTNSPTALVALPVLGVTDF